MIGFIQLEADCLQGFDNTLFVCILSRSSYLIWYDWVARVATMENIKLLIMNGIFQEVTYPLKIYVSKFEVILEDHSVEG